MISKKITKDNKVKSSVSALLVVRILNRALKRQLLDYVAETYSKVNARDTVKEIIQKLNENILDDIENDKLIKQIKEIIIPQILVDEDAKSNNIEILKQVHARRKSLVYVGIKTPEHTYGFVHRQAPIVLSGHTLLTKWLFDFIYNRSATYKSTYSNQYQRILRLSSFVPDANQSISTAVTLLPDEWVNSFKNGSFDKLLARTKKQIGQPDLVIIDNIEVLDNSIKPLLLFSKLLNLFKQSATALVIGTNTKLCKTQCDLELVRTADTASIKIGNLDTLDIPVRLADKIERTL